MSWACLNIDPGMPNHPKIIALEAKIGDAALTYLLRLWCWAAMDCTDGNLSRFNNINFIERRIMRWDGAPGALLEAFMEAELIDVNDGQITIRNFGDRNPHLQKMRERQRAAANARWKKYRAQKRLTEGGQ